MRLQDWIAFRYLNSKKSHGAVSAITIVSVAGVAIATAAVVCILSVFNGFVSVLTDKMDTLAPDIVVTPRSGKVMANADSLEGVLMKVEGVESVMPVVADQALTVYEGRELPVTVKGVDTERMERQTGIAGAILEGGRMPAPYYEEMPEFEYYEDYEEYLANTPRPEVLPSVGVAARLGNIVTGEHLIIFAPRREGRYNPANPMSSFVADSVSVSGVFETHQRDVDEGTVIVPIGLARHLFQYDSEATSLEIKVRAGFDQGATKAAVLQALGPGYEAKDKAELQEINFRMVNIEKWVAFLLLVFILVIAGFNIISTMTMLVLEKKGQIRVMHAVGMSKARIGAVFRSESLMVSLTGGAIGIVLGVILCWLQQEYGLVRLHGDPRQLLMASYPVKLVGSDVALAFVPSVVLGVITAFIAGAFARSRAARA